ncbi:hypothetical protein GIB67_029636 [Kingdonia uniflora]|uniref:Uncharacterized protein n=1 Tax=Kingdonia uniflora TaxID=39325 RepID=A0A7J7LLE7_9MAGN|nr:hypothetical protein GIB67_029636 [Kingdonia uniflora]
MRERFSIPFFFNPSNDMMVKPIKELVNECNPSKYTEFNWEGNSLRPRMSGIIRSVRSKTSRFIIFRISD